MAKSAIAQVCLGRWRAILPRLGLDQSFLTGRHCPCPICGGKDRFRFDDQEGRGTWIRHREMDLNRVPWQLRKFHLQTSCSRLSGNFPLACDGLEQLLWGFADPASSGSDATFLATTINAGAEAANAGKSQ